VQDRKHREPLAPAEVQLRGSDEVIGHVHIGGRSGLLVFRVCAQRVVEERPGFRNGDQRVLREVVGHGGELAVDERQVVSVIIVMVGMVSFIPIVVGIASFITSLSMLTGYSA
jgi:hypothetical protein